MDDILKLKKPKWFISLGLIITLSAIACGVWEFALRPITLKLAKIMFIIITFGSKSAIDGFYQSASTGYKPSFGWLWFCLGGFASMTTLWLVDKWHFVSFI